MPDSDPDDPTRVEPATLPFSGGNAAKAPPPTERLTARDLIACQAMAGYLAGCGQKDADVDFPSDTKLARWSYDLADAMLRHRARTAAPTPGA